MGNSGKNNIGKIKSTIGSGLIKVLFYTNLISNTAEPYTYVHILLYVEDNNLAM